MTNPLTPAQASMVADNVGLAIFLVNNRYRPDPNNRDDLVGQAYVGLCEAARRWDPERGVPFGAYARFWVIKFCNQWLGLNRTIRPPWHVVRSNSVPEVSVVMSIDDETLQTLLEVDPIHDVELRVALDQMRARYPTEWAILVEEIATPDVVDELTEAELERYESFKSELQELLQ